MRCTSPPRSNSCSSRSYASLARTTALAAVIAAISQVSHAAPDPMALPGGAVGPASVVTDTATSTMTVTLDSPRTVINWSSYSIGSDATVVYANDLAANLTSSAVLNRVIGSSSGSVTTIPGSEIYGRLTSADNISVYLVNPAGILFSPGSTVSVGSLIASTRDIADVDFLAGRLRFASAPGDPDPGPSLVLTGDRLVTAGATGAGSFKANGGFIGLIAAKIVTTGTIEAQHEVALIAANDTTLSFTAGSPLHVTVAEGTNLGDPMVLRGTVKGSSVLLAAATRNNVMEGLLDIDADLTATSAYGTDQGIMLAAGKTKAAAATIDLPDASDNAGVVALRLAGSLSSKIGSAPGASGGGIDVRSANGLLAPAAGATFDADGAVLVRADASGIKIGDARSRLVSATANGIDISAGTGDVTLGMVAAGEVAVGPAAPGSNGAGATIGAGAGAVKLAGLFASRSAAITGQSVTIESGLAGGSVVTEAGTLQLTATQGGISAASLTSAGRLSITAATAVTIDSATTTGTDANVVVSASQLGGLASARADLDAGRDLSLQITGSAMLGAASAGRDLAFSSGAIDANSLVANGRIDATASTFSAGDVSANDAVTLRATTSIGIAGEVRSANAGIDASAPSVTLNDADAATSLTLTSTSQALKLNGSAIVGGAATLTSAGDAVVGTIDADTIGIGAAGALSANRLTATQTIGDSDALTAGAASIDISTAQATGGTARLTATTGDARVGVLEAGVDAVLRAAGTATLSGSAIIGHDLIVSGVDVRLGGSDPVLQQAGRLADYTATSGSIARTDNAGALLSIRGDAAGQGTGAIILDATTAIDLPATALATGDPANPTASGEVGIRLTQVGAPLTLGTVDSAGLFAASADHATFSALDLPGAVTLGQANLIDTLQLSAQGQIRLAGIAVVGQGQSLSISALSGASGITAIDTLSARGGVTVSAPGTVALADVSGGGGIADLGSSASRLTALTVSGTQVRVSAFDDVALGSVAATANGATLTSETGALTVSGATDAFGDIVFDAPGAIRLGNARSSAGTIAFLSSGEPPQGAIIAGSLRASDTLSIIRPTAITLAGVRSDNGDVLVEAGGLLRVSGATTAARSVLLAGDSLSLGAVSANSGPLTLIATGGGIAASGDLGATGTITIDAPGAIALGDVTSSNDAIVFQSSLAPPVGALSAGAVRSRTDLDVSRDAGLTFGSATSTGGAVRLASANGTVTVDGALTAATDASVNAVAARLGSVTASSGAIDLTTTSGPLSSGALRAAGDISATSATGVTIAGANSLGGDVRLLATSGSLGVTAPILAAGSVRANAATDLVADAVTASGGTVDLDAEGGRFSVGVVSARGAVSGRSAGDMTLASVTSRTGAVALVSDGGAITIAGPIAANDFVTVDGATRVTLAGVTDTGTGGSLLRSRGGTLSAGPVSVAGPLTITSAAAATLGTVASSGGPVLIDAGGTLAASDVSAYGALTMTGAAALRLDSARSTTSTVTLSSTGPVTVLGPTIGQTGVTAATAGLLVVGDVTAPQGALSLTSTADAVSAAQLAASGPVTIAGRTGVTLASVRSAEAGVALSAGDGGITVAGIARGQGDVDVSAQGAIMLADVSSDGGQVAIASDAGSVRAATITAARMIDASAAGNVTIGALDARGLGDGAPGDGGARLTSSQGGIVVTAATTRGAFTADAARTLAIEAATIGGDASVAGSDVAVTRIASGTLLAVARGGGLTLGQADVSGAATLTKTGASGAIAVTRLSAGGPTGIASDGDIRVQSLLGGPATLTANGDVSGLTGGLNAAVDALTVAAGGSATIGAVATTGTAQITAEGAAQLTDLVTAGGDLIVSGGTVTLGSVGQAVSQSTAGRVTVTAGAGPIVGLTGLTLTSDAGGLGGGTRDLTLAASGAITFAPGTLIAAGADRQSAVRLAAGQGSPIVLDAVQARTIASPGTAASLRQAGPVAINRLSTGEALTITLTGGAGSALDIGTTEVRSGDLVLDAAGPLTIGSATVPRGTATLAGMTIAAGPILADGLNATARDGAADFTTIAATGGDITISAATDLRLQRADATGRITLTSSAGDITGISDGHGGFAPAALTSSGGAVTVRAESDVTGAIRLGQVSGAGGISLSGRTIGAEALVASAGGVDVAIIRDAAGIADTALSIGTIDAAGTITLTTGDSLAGGGPTLALDRATSAGGDIVITVPDGGLGSRLGSPRTRLSAPNGTISGDVGGAAQLGSVQAATIRLAATTLNIDAASAGTGDLALTARAGPLVLGSGSAIGTVSLIAMGDAAIGQLVARDATVSGSGDIAAQAITTTLSLAVSAGHDLTVTTISSGGGITLSAGNALSVGGVAGGAGLTLTGERVALGTVLAARLDLAAGFGGFALASGAVAGDAVLRSAGDGTIGRLGADTITISNQRVLTADTLRAARQLSLTAAGVRVGTAAAAAGSLQVTAGEGGLALGDASAGGAIGLTSSAGADVTGAVAAGGDYRIDAASVTLGTADTAVRQAGANVKINATAGAINGLGALTLTAGGDAMLTARGAGGAITLSPTSTLVGDTSVTLATSGLATLGAASSPKGEIVLQAADAALSGALTAPAVTITNIATAGITRLGDTPTGNETEFAATARRFDLSAGEIGLIAASRLTIDSGARDVVIGGVSLAPSTGSSRFAIVASGRIDVLGRLTAPGSPRSRVIALGSAASTTNAQTAILRIAATPAAGGRVIAGEATLELTADRIGVGLDRDFLSAIGYQNAAGLSAEQVTTQYVSRPTSTLYQAGALGAAPYVDPVLIHGGALHLTYSRYALIQNTGLPGSYTGVEIGSFGSGSGASLSLSTEGSTTNAFALFGLIDGIGDQAAALLGSQHLALDSGVSPVATRINGCIIGSGAGCLNSNLGLPSINAFDISRAEIVRSADDLRLPFDPLIGTNNEALYLDADTGDTDPACESDKPCPTVKR